MEARRIWAIRAGTTGQADRIFLEQQQIGLSSADVDDDMSEKPASRDAFKEAFSALVLRVRPESIPSLAGQLFRFVHDVKIGDSVVYPRKSDRTLHWGEITGPYVFSSLEGETFAHRRSVQWKAKLRRDQFSPGALYELGATLSLFEVKSFAEEILGKFDPPAANDPEGAPAQCESEIARGAAMATRDFIVKKLNSELKGYLLEPFVADLFRAMGYRTHTTRKTRDNGIDVIAHRDELGIEPPILKIQVKAQEASIGADCVKAFAAMVLERDVGIFITTGGYSSAAREFARTRADLKLIDGVAFVELIQKYYDGLELNSRRQIPLRRVLVPDVTIDHT